MHALIFDIDGTLHVPLCMSDDHADRREIMRQALRRLGDGIERVTYYGDGQWDVQAAASLGWDFVAVGAKLGGIARFEVGPAGT